MAMERTDKILSSQGSMSRSEVKELIKKGKVLANGRPVKKPEEKYDPETTEFVVDGKRTEFRKFVYIMMNKPKGVLSASRDRNEKTVIDLLPPEMKRKDLFPAGRLDRDTEGFMLITDDGELAHKMLSPKSHVYKLYEAECSRELCEEDVRKFAKGIVCGDIEFLPAQMKLLGENRALVEICEGKFHQIKKMFQSVGTEVTALKRLRIGAVFLDPELAPGESRYLTEGEIIDILSLNHGI